MGIQKKLLILFTLFSICFAAALYSQQSDGKFAEQKITEKTDSVSKLDSNSKNESPALQTGDFNFDDNSLYFNTQNSQNNNQSYQSKTGISFYVRMIVVLLLIIALIIYLMRFFKNKVDPVVEDSLFLRRAASISLGPGKSVEIVSLLDNKAYVLGVTDSQINLIAKIGETKEEQELIQALNLEADKRQTKVRPYNFTDVLEMFTRKNRNSGTPSSSKAKTSLFSGFSGIKGNIFSDTEKKVEDFVRNHEESEIKAGRNEE